MAKAVTVKKVETGRKGELSVQGHAKVTPDRGEGEWGRLLKGQPYLVYQVTGVGLTKRTGFWRN